MRIIHLKLTLCSVAQSCLALCNFTNWSTPGLPLFSSVAHLVMSDSLLPHGLQHARPPCPSPTPRACSNSCPLSQWCHPTILSSVVPFFSCLQSFPASGSFPACIRWPKYQSFSFSISSSNEQSRLIPFRMGWFDLLAVQGTLKSLLHHHSSKALILWRSVFFMVQLSTSVHDYWKSCIFD